MIDILTAFVVGEIVGTLLLVVAACVAVWEYLEGD